MTIILSSGEKSDVNPFLEFAWQSLIEVPGTFAGAWLSDHIGRKYTGGLPYVFCSLMFGLILLERVVSLHKLKHINIPFLYSHYAFLIITSKLINLHHECLARLFGLAFYIQILIYLDSKIKRIPSVRKHF
jgi:hypothetical protein